MPMGATMSGMGVPGLMGMGLGMGTMPGLMGMGLGMGTMPGLLGLGMGMGMGMGMPGVGMLNGMQVGGPGMPMGMGLTQAQAGIMLGGVAQPMGVPTSGPGPDKAAPTSALAPTSSAAVQRGQGHGQHGGHHGGTSTTATVTMSVPTPPVMPVDTGASPASGTSVQAMPPAAPGVVEELASTRPGDALDVTAQSGDGPEASLPVAQADGVMMPASADGHHDVDGSRVGLDSEDPRLRPQLDAGREGGAGDRDGHDAATNHGRLSAPPADGANAPTV